MRRPDRSRLRQPRLSFRGRVLLSLGALVFPLAILKAIDVDLGTSLGVAGTAFGVATFLIGEYRSRDTPPRKKVVYVSQSDTRFNANVLDGFREILSDAFPNDLSIHKPEHGDLHRLANWQVELLVSAEVREASAIVIVPPHGDPQIWDQLADRMRDGVFVVVVDVRPDSRHFMQHDLSPPSFVSSDFVRGGRAVGKLITQRLQDDTEALALVCLGPEPSEPGRTRSTWALYELARGAVLSRVHTFELPSWVPEDSLDDICTRVTELVTRTARDVIVYCGTDWIMSGLEDRLEVLTVTRSSISSSWATTA
jgi:hypothetical protein